MTNTQQNAADTGSHVRRHPLATFNFVIFIALLVFATTGRAGPLDTWIWRTPFPTGNPLQAITYSGGQFVAVGNLGTVVTSTDGTNWSVRKPATQYDLISVAYGAGHYVAAGYACGLTRCDGIILSSEDGANWVQTSLPHPVWGLNSAAYGNGRFVAVGDSGVLTSIDGSNWTDGNLSVAFQKVVYANNQFLAVPSSNGGPGGLSGTNSDSGTIAISTNGVDWIRVATSVATGPVDLYDIVYGNGQFVAVGAISGILTSSNGANWVQLQPVTAAAFGSITFLNGQFIAVASDGTEITSIDGVNWIQTHPVGTGFGGSSTVAYGAGRYLAVGYNGIQTSPDAINWTPIYTGTQLLLRGIAYGNGRFEAVNWDGYDGTGIFESSTNGVDWQTQPGGGFSITFANGRFLALQRNRTLTSTDGVAWGEGNLGTENGLLHAIAYGNGRFVGLATDGITGTSANETNILTSIDGTNWVQGPPLALASGSLNSVGYGAGQFLIVGDLGTILASTDGLTWSQRASGITDSLSGVAYGNGQFVAVGSRYNSVTQLDEGFFFSSTDGANWVSRGSDFGTLPPLYAVAYGNGHFVAVGSAGTILESASVISLGLSSPSGNKPMSLTLEGPTGPGYAIQTSTNLLFWETITPNIALTNSTTVLTNVPTPVSDHLFYRAVSQ